MSREPGCPRIYAGEDVTVLYVVWGYPKISETYIKAEIGFMLRSGVKVEVWSPIVGTVGMMGQVPVHRGTVSDAIKAVKPDLIHVHYLNAYHDAFEIAAEEGIPVTVRGHSFDFSPGNCRRVADWPCVLRIYLFPHFAARMKGEQKVYPLPVAFDPREFTVDRPKIREMVLRTAAAKATKGLHDFIGTASLCPAHQFVLVANVVHSDYMTKLRDQAKGSVFFFEDMSNENTAGFTRMAGIYMDTNDPDLQPFGMPVSIAEALAAGCYVLVRRSRAAEEFLGGAGALYESQWEAAHQIKATLDWDDAKWAEVGCVAVERSRAFHDSVVLPRMLEDWKTLAHTR